MAWAAQVAVGAGQDAPLAAEQVHPPDADLLAAAR